MDVSSPPLFDSNLNLPPDTFLGSKYFNPSFLFDKQVTAFENFFSFLTNPDLVNTYRTILALLAMFFLAVIFYTIIRLLEIRKKEEAHVHHEIEEYRHKHAAKNKAIAEDEAISKNARWREVLHLLFSQNQNDWKLSVIEADSMLEKLLTDLGYKGDNLGEKLKAAGEQGFRYLNDAWEVHTIRNRVAHEGTVFELSHHEAKRAIAIYEQIFRDFGYI